jgi:hypothetical protein
VHSIPTELSLLLSFFSNFVIRMAAVSDDLIWLLVKNNNRFLVKRNGNNNNSVQFSSEPNNLYNLNTFKYSGTISLSFYSSGATGLVLKSSEMLY